MLKNTVLSEPDKVGFSFWLQWAVLSTVGTTAGFFFYYLWAFSATNGDVYVLGRGSIVNGVLLAIAGAAVGLAIGIFQWPALRERMPQSGSWLWVNAVVWSVGFTAGWNLLHSIAGLWEIGMRIGLLQGYGPARDDHFLLWSYVTAGNLAMITQAVLLSRRVSSAFWWMPIGLAALLVVPLVLLWKLHYIGWLVISGLVTSLIAYAASRQFPPYQPPPLWDPGAREKDKFVLLRAMVAVLLLTSAVRIMIEIFR
jgi:hypothetical protein